MTNPYRKLYVSGKYSPEWSSIKNFFKVFGYSDSDLGITYSGTAQDNNPDSATNTATPPAGIGLKPEVITNENLTTNDLCNQQAIKELRDNLRKIDRSSHNIIPLPFLGEGDCVQLENEGAGIVDDKYEIQAITENLGLGLMTIETWQVKNIYEIVLFSQFGSMEGWEQLGDGIVDIYGFSGNNVLRKSTNGDPGGGYCLLDKTVVDFELIVYTRRDSVGTEDTNIYILADSDGNGYGISVDYTSGAIAALKRTAWATVEDETDAYALSYGDWYTLRLTKIGSSVTAELYSGKEDTFGSPLTSALLVDSSYVSFDRAAVCGGYTFYSDDLTVRKIL